MSIPMILDVERARRETPGCEDVLHFNNAGSSLMPEPVLRATVGHLELEARMGATRPPREEKVAERVYGAAAQMLGCGPDEVAVIENATRAWDMAFYSTPFSPGDRILTAQAEYASNFIAFLQVARRTGASVEVVPNDESGRLSVEALRGMMDGRVKLVAMTHVPTNGGLVNPGGGGRGGPRGGLPLPARRLPVRRADAPRRRRDRLRHALRDGPQVPARPEGDGVSLRAEGDKTG